MDRGKFGRRIEDYKRLIPNNLTISNEMIVPIGYYAKLFIMVLEPTETLERKNHIEAPTIPPVF